MLRNYAFYGHRAHEVNLNLIESFKSTFYHQSFFSAPLYLDEELVCAVSSCCLSTFETMSSCQRYPNQEKLFLLSFLPDLKLRKGPTTNHTKAFCAGLPLEHDVDNSYLKIS